MTTTSARPVIAIIEDESDLLSTITRFLVKNDFNVRGFSDARSFMNVFTTGASIDCILSDVKMAKTDGIALTKMVRDLDRSIPILLMTGHGQISTAIEAIKAGADEFIEKPVCPPHLLTIVDKNLKKGIVIAPAKSDLSKDETTGLASLTRHEKDILRLIAQGLTNREVGLHLGLTPRTVETYRRTMMEKLHARSLSDAIRIQLASDGCIDEGLQ